MYQKSANQLNNMFKLVAIFFLSLACHGFSQPSRSVKSTANRYFFYQKSSGLSPTEITVASGITMDDDSLTCVILIHGHGGSVNDGFNSLIVPTMLDAEDVNIIVVDWSILSSGSYSAAVLAVPAVAKNVQELIVKLNTDVAGIVGRMHIVGFNLGAHIAGIAARQLTSLQVARITGLDPSGSNWGPSSDRLRATDAAYVEVIHTDGNSLLGNGIGTPLGKVDFFANGGGNQPGCVTHTCCHQRAYELFAATFINPALYGNQCGSNAQMTLNLCRGTRLRMGTNTILKTQNGIYRINTGRRFPF